MTRVTVEYEGDRIRRLECAGHAGDAAQGENIVCAAVSVLMQTCVNAIEQVAGIPPKTTVDESRALIALEGVEDRRGNAGQVVEEVREGRLEVVDRRGPRRPSRVSDLLVTFGHAVEARSGFSISHESFDLNNGNVLRSAVPAMLP